MAQFTITLPNVRVAQLAVAVLKIAIETLPDEYITAAQRQLILQDLAGWQRGNSQLIVSNAAVLDRLIFCWNAPVTRDELGHTDWYRWVKQALLAAQP